MKFVCCDGVCVLGYLLTYIGAAMRCCAGGQCVSLWLDGMETMLELIAWPDNEVGVHGSCRITAYIVRHTVISFNHFHSQWRRQRGGGKREASPLWVYGKIGRQLIC